MAFHEKKNYKFASQKPFYTKIDQHVSCLTFIWYIHGIFSPPVHYGVCVIHIRDKIGLLFKRCGDCDAFKDVLPFWSFSAFFGPYREILARL